MLTQGSVLRPQPWAGESQLLQSCCCLLEAPPHALPKGRELLPAEFKMVMWFAFPFEKAGRGLLVGWGFSLAFSLLFIAPGRVMKLIQKAVAADGGFALAVMSVPTVGKRVFLRVVSAIPTVMHGMTPSSATVQEAAFGRSKSPAFAGAKTTAYWSPPPNPSQWARGLLWQFLSWSVRVGNGASGWDKNKKGTPLSPNLC